MDNINLKLKNFPLNNFYEKGYIFDNIINNITINNDLIIIMNINGEIMFWKKDKFLISFLKTIKAHNAPISDFSILDNKIITVSNWDKTIKFFDWNYIDLIWFFKLDYIPIYVSLFKSNLNKNLNILLINENNFILYNDNFVLNENIKFKSKNNIKLIKNLKLEKKLIIIDYKENIDIFDLNTFDYMKFNKIKTDLYVLIKNKEISNSITISNNENYFIIFTQNLKFYLFNSSFKIIFNLNTSFNNLNNLYKLVDIKNFIINQNIIEKRKNYEKIIENNKFRFESIINDNKGIIIIPTFFGITFIDFKESKKIIKIIGENENIRFFNLFFLKNKVNIKKKLWKKDNNNKDPLILTFYHNKLMIFSQKILENKDNRDIDFSKNSLKDDSKINQANNYLNIKTNKMVIVTNLGEIFIELYRNKAAKTCENFMIHSLNGYYNNQIFHRVIKNFMIQTGCPKGDGTGGNSIWGNKFNDEFDNDLTHTSFTLSMANTGKNTNGSQFFITTVNCNWLDKKHTIFGKVIRGKEVVKEIENIKTDNLEKPLIDIYIKEIKVIIK